MNAVANNKMNFVIKLNYLRFNIMFFSFTFCFINDFKSILFASCFVFTYPYNSKVAITYKFNNKNNNVYIFYLYLVYFIIKFMFLKKRNNLLAI